MELVIKIEEERYNQIKRCADEFLASGLERAVKNGIPLPKEHGRLIILSEDVLKKNQINVDFSPTKWIGEVGLSNATVAIVEADRSDEE